MTKDELVADLTEIIDVGRGAYDLVLSGEPDDAELSQAMLMLGDVVMDLQDLRDRLREY